MVIALFISFDFDLVAPAIEPALFLLSLDDDRPHDVFDVLDVVLRSIGKNNSFPEVINESFDSLNKPRPSWNKWSCLSSVGNSLNIKAIEGSSGDMAIDSLVLLFELFLVGQVSASGVITS